MRALFLAVLATAVTPALGACTGGGGDEPSGGLCAADEAVPPAVEVGWSPDGAFVACTGMPEIVATVAPQGGMGLEFDARTQSLEVGGGRELTVDMEIRHMGTSLGVSQLEGVPFSCAAVDVGGAVLGLVAAFDFDAYQSQADLAPLDGEPLELAVMITDHTGATAGTTCTTALQVP
jgi:hypothetical protein